jgi:hypothetical protein
MSGKVVVTLDTVVCGDPPTVLASLNTPPSPEGQTPPGGLCASAALRALCGASSVLGRITGGCGTTGYACLPVEELSPTCTQTGGKAAYVVGQAGGSGKQAQFQGCCVQKGAASGTKRRGQTCKKIRVGRRYRPGGSRFRFTAATGSTVGGTAAAGPPTAASKFVASPGGPLSGKDSGSDRKLLTLPMNPLVQLGSCECFNLREHVSTYSAHRCLQACMKPPALQCAPSSLSTLLTTHTLSNSGLKVAAAMHTGGKHQDRPLAQYPYTAGIALHVSWLLIQKACRVGLGFVCFLDSA